MPLDHRDGCLIRFFLNFNNQPSVQSLGLLKHEVNTQDFIFQGIPRWPAINVITLNLQIFSLETIVGSRKPDQFK